MIRNLAHRGASAYAPENTLAAFYKGIEMGANGIETDLRVSKDGMIVLFHDRDLSPKTDGSGPVNDYLWNELKERDAGSWFSGLYKGERLVLLEEFFFYFGKKDLYFDLELKEHIDFSKALQLIDKYDVKEKITITSKMFDALENARAIDKDIRLGYLVSAINGEVMEKLDILNAQQVCPNINEISKEDVEKLKNSGYMVRVHKVKSEEIMKRAVEIGVDGMTINFPDVLARFIKGI